MSEAGPALSSGPIRVDLEAVLVVIDRMAGFGRDLDLLTEDVDGRVRRLHVSWEGAAAAAHQRAHSEWLGGAREMHAALSRMRQIVLGAHANYVAAVGANRRMWG